MKKILIIPLLALILIGGLISACVPCADPCASPGNQNPPVNQNQPPVLNLIGDKVFNEGQPLTFTILATDPDGDPLAYSASNLPTGANFTPATRTFSWIPGYDQAGTYEDVHFEVTDGELSDYENIAINVTDNQAPVLDVVGNQTVSEGQPLSFTISATDPDGDPLAYSASNLPTGANFTPAIRTFSWIPGYDQAGTYEDVHFEVTDGELIDSEEITITVVNLTLNATVDIDADTINLRASRKWLTAYIEYIELPTEYQPESVDLFTVRLNLNGAPAIPAVTDPEYDFVTDPAVYIQDHDGDGILERMVKFDFSLVKPLLELGDNVLLVTGRLIDWPAMPDFEGTDTIKVIK